MLFMRFPFLRKNNDAAVEIDGKSEALVAVYFDQDDGPDPDPRDPATQPHKKN